MFVNRTHLHPLESRYGETLYAEASDLGFPPGRWPKKIVLSTGETLPVDEGRSDDSGKVYGDPRRLLTVIVYND